MKSFVGPWIARWRQRWAESRSFYGKVKGVIHVGANLGQERFAYSWWGLDVIWIEPVPATFELLCENLKDFPQQRAFCCLITDRDGQEYTFHIADNAGASSSILPFARHKEMWPDISYSGEIELSSVTLDSFIARERIRSEHFEALVLDTQGSELLILRGAVNLLRNLRFVTVEVPDFESYDRMLSVG